MVSWSVKFLSLFVVCLFGWMTFGQKYTWVNGKRGRGHGMAFFVYVPCS